MLTLIIWKHSVGPCPRAELEPLAFLDTFLDRALHGLLPPAGTSAAPADAPAHDVA
jgi:hypothetical protein